MKLLLVKPPVRYPVKDFDVGVPTTLNTLAYHAALAGNSVEVVDYRLKQMRGEQFDVSADLARYDVVGTSACTSEILEVGDLFRVAKELGLKTIAGGIYPTANPHTTLMRNHADVVVRGEGEVSLPILLDALENGRSLDEVPGIVYSTHKSIIETGPAPVVHELDSLTAKSYGLEVKPYAELGSLPIPTFSFTYKFSWNKK